MSFSLLLTGTGVAQEQEVCPHAKGWKPEDLEQRLSDHRQLVEKTRIVYEERDSTRSENIGFTIEWMQERMARWPVYAKEWWGEWEKPPPGAVNFCNADLRHAELENAVLDWADFSNADLSFAKLSGAELRYAELKAAILTGAQLDGADLKGANLNRAILKGAKLDNATLSSTVLTGARLEGTSVKETRLSYADLSDAVYVPASQPPYFDVAGIRGLETLRILFGPGGESGLVQLRDLIQKAGLRDLERKATFAIERGKTRYAFYRGFEGSVDGFVEGFFRLVAFDLTTGYGLYPGRALKIIGVVWFLLGLIYFWPIRFEPKRSSASGIYQVWPSDRIEASGGTVTLRNSAKVNRLKRDGPLAAFVYAAYFSLLSAFHIGWRDLNVGTWIARIQPREYALRASGWVRVVSGIQSLLSVYLVALWALTYFGRPFQ